MIDTFQICDNLELFSQIESDSIDLIYIDPPYNTGRNSGDFVDKFENMKTFRDSFLKPRLQECHRVLKKTGNIVVHVEPKISHHVRILLDEIFGDKMFANEIVWTTGGNAKTKKNMNRNHDTLIWYKVSNNSTFNPIYKEYDENYKKSSGVKVCEFTGKEYVTTAIHNSQPDVNPRFNLRYEWNGFHRQWYVSKEKMIYLHENNRLHYNKRGIPRIKRYLEEMDGIPVRDIWDDISNTQKDEKLDYATQKPVKLLERIVKMFSNEEETVMDIFAGSGTLGRAAINLNRHYILSDINPKAKEVFLSSINNQKEDR